jgi:hypothetical protein
VRGGLLTGLPRNSTCRGVANPRAQIAGNKAVVWTLSDGAVAEQLSRAGVRPRVCGACCSRRFAALWAATHMGQEDVIVKGSTRVVRRLLFNDGPAEHLATVDTKSDCNRRCGCFDFI